MFKDIISHQEGQYLFPGMPTVIKGNQSATPITMKGLQKPQIAITPYGASYMTPGMDYNFAGNTVAEIPTAQMGGSQQDQIVQLIAAYAKKIGKDPKEIIGQIQQLSEQEQQQAIQAIMQDMQQSTAGADVDQDMMADGGCVDCQEQFPQAQDLNWFYKAQMGQQVDNSLLNIPESQRFPQPVNTTVTYPEGYWESKTKVPSNVPLNFMGQPYATGAIEESISPLDLIGGVRGAAGLAKGILKYRKALKPNLIQWGDELIDLGPHPKTVKRAVNQMHRGAREILSPSPFAEGGTAFPAANMYPESWVGYNGTAYKFGGEEAYPQAQTYLPYDRPGETRANFMFEYGGQSDINKIYEVMKKGGFNMNPKKKKGGQMDNNSFMDYVMKNGGYVPDYQDGSEVYDWTRRDLRKWRRTGQEPMKTQEDTGVDNNQNLQKQMERQARRQQKQIAQAANPYDPTGLEYANMMSMHTSKPTLTQGILAGVNLLSGLGDAISGYGKLAGKLFAEGGDLPKHQTKGQIGSGYDPYLTTGTPMQQYAIRMQQQQQPTQIASWNQTEESVVGTPQPTGAASSTPNKSPFDLGYMNQKAARSVNKLGYVADFLERWNQEKDADKRSQKRGSTDLSFGVNPLMDRGDYTTNVTQGPNFRPDQYRFAQKDVNYYDKGPLQNIVKYGGILDQLEDGGVYDLSDDEIREILSAGGSIEYI